VIDNGPWDFVMRQPEDVVNGLIRPVLHDLLADADEAVRQQALSVLTNLPTYDGTVARLFEAARQPALYRTPALAAAMAQALSVYASGAGRGREAAAAIRVLIGTGVPPAGAATVLALHDPDFAAAVALQAGDAAPSFAAQVAAIFAGYRRERLLPYLAQLAPLSVETRLDAWSRMEVFLALSPDRAAQLAASQGIEAAAVTPSLEAARTALGI
jgi:hypothetical protein